MPDAGGPGDYAAGDVIRESLVQWNAVVAENFIGGRASGFKPGDRVMATSPIAVSPRQPGSATNEFTEDG